MIPLMPKHPLWHLEFSEKDRVKDDEYLLPNNLLIKREKGGLFLAKRSSPIQIIDKTFRDFYLELFSLQTKTSLGAAYIQGIGSYYSEINDFVFNILTDGIV